MSQDELLKKINLVRRDLGNLLFHFTTKPKENVVIKEPNRTTYLSDNAPPVLYKILREGKLLGSSHWIRGGYKCICFTESPISELAALFSLSRIMSETEDRPRYEPFGIAVTKEWLFAQGGRPVIYQPESEFELLPDELKYRHVRFEPQKGIDHTWEREWRIKTEELKLDPKQTLVVVPTFDYAFEFAYDFAEVKPDYDDIPEPQGFYHEPKWMVVSLDLFGFKDY